MANSALVHVKTLEEAEIEQLLEVLSEKRAEVTQMTVALAELRQEVQRFEVEYHSRLSAYYHELDRLRLMTQEYHLRLRLVREGLPPYSQEMDARVGACFHTQRQRLTEAEPSTDGAQKPNSPPPLSSEQQARLRKLYLQLAKRYHPGKSQDETERTERERMMALVNHAYEQRDLVTLDRLSTAAEPLQAEGTRERKARITEDLNRLMGTIGSLRLEISRIQSSQTYRLKEELKTSRGRGTDLFGLMARGLQRQINTSRRNLETLIQRFRMFAGG